MVNLFIAILHLTQTSDGTVILSVFYLGYTLYNISYHNPFKSIDLPVFIDIEKASQHDALTTISASARFFDICEELHPKYICFDSASDCLPIFQFFRQKHIIPIIDRNQRNSGNNPFEKYNLTLEVETKKWC